MIPHRGLDITRTLLQLIVQQGDEALYRRLIDALATSLLDPGSRAALLQALAAPDLVRQLRSPYFETKILPICYDIMVRRQEMGDLLAAVLIVDGARPQDHTAPHLLLALLDTVQDREVTLAVMRVLDRYRHHPVIARRLAAAQERSLLVESDAAATIRLIAAVEPLDRLVSLGAKLYPGSPHKEIFAPTIDAQQLARQIGRALRGPGELQISVGFDTGAGARSQRAKFVALALFIAATHMERFAALAQAPHRDPGASYGLVIRGKVVNPISPLNRADHRLDYLFQIDSAVSTEELTRWITFVQSLNLGLLLSTAYRTFADHTGRPFPRVPRQHAAVALRYEQFERDLVGLLRTYDALADPAAIYAIPDRPAEHAARQAALTSFLLEESLYCSQKWVHDFQEESGPGWNRLLAHLRGIEAVMLHRSEWQGDLGWTEGVIRGDAPPGDHLIGETRALVEEAALEIRQAAATFRSAPFPQPAGEPLPAEKDPFLDDRYPDACRRYATDAAQGVQAGRTRWADFPEAERLRAYLTSVR